MASTPIPNNDMVPVYLPFATFRSAVQGLRSHGLPDRIEKTAWNSRSGADQTQILSAFRFLGFISSLDESPTDRLKKLVDAQEDTDEERQILAELLQAKYARVFDINLKTATPGALADAIGSYGTMGATKKRAVRFFIKAATHARIPLSTRLTINLRERSGSGDEAAQGGGDNAEPNAPVTPRRRPKRRPPPPPAVTPPNDSSTPKPAGTAKTVSLKSGGTLTLSATLDLFSLNPEDRKFVFELIDKLEGYAQPPKPAEESE
jgi:hypothetical protein